MFTVSNILFLGIPYLLIIKERYEPIQTAYRLRLLRAGEEVDGDLNTRKKEKGKGKRERIALNFPQVQIFQWKYQIVFIPIQIAINDFKKFKPSFF